MTLKTRPPTGVVPWPLILVEGPEKSGKSWACAELSTSDKVGQTYWIDLGEGAADEYGAVKGARYLVVDHDGSWGDIVAQIQAVRAEAEKAAASGEPPVVLVVDSMTAEWDLLKDWAGERARKSERSRKILQQDPHAEVPVPMNLWNDATARHRRLMTLLLTFPGVVVVTARGKEVAEIDDKGKPVPNSRDYKVEGHKTLAFDASVWVRMSREQAPVVVGARSVHAGLRPGVDRPKPIPDFTLEKVIFDILKCSPAEAQVRNLRELSSAEAPDPLAAVKAEVWQLALKRGWSAEDLAEDYARTYDGKLLKGASVEELAEYRDILAHAREAA